MRMTAEYDNPVTGEKMREMSLNKTLNIYKIMYPPIGINDPCLPILIISGNILTYQVCDMDNGISPVCKFCTDCSFSGPGCTGYTLKIVHSPNQPRH
jgi:hypothetical protein